MCLKMKIILKADVSSAAGETLAKVPAPWPLGPAAGAVVSGRGSTFAHRTTGRATWLRLRPDTTVYLL